MSTSKWGQDIVALGASEGVVIDTEIDLFIETWGGEGESQTERLRSAMIKACRGRSLLSVIEGVATATEKLNSPSGDEGEVSAVGKHMQLLSHVSKDAPRKESPMH